jgi:UDP:flavonoid glycosyltransferase YjiC (YdhE family)
MTARRIAELGLGIVLDAQTTTAQDLREAVEKVYRDQAMHERARAMSQIVRTAGGAQSAADAIIQFVHTSLSVARS